MEPGDLLAEPFETNRYHGIHKRVRRITDLDSHKFFLEKQKSDAKKAMLDFDPTSGDAPPVPVKYDTATKDFVSIIRNASSAKAL